MSRLQKRRQRQTSHDTKRFKKLKKELLRWRRVLATSHESVSRQVFNVESTDKLQQIWDAYQRDLDIITHIDALLEHIAGLFDEAYEPLKVPELHLRTFHMELEDGVNKVVHDEEEWRPEPSS